MSESENATIENYENQPIIPLDLAVLFHLGENIVDEHLLKTTKKIIELNQFFIEIIHFFRTIFVCQNIKENDPDLGF